jgi:hypothetical protein
LDFGMGGLEILNEAFGGPLDDEALIGVRGIFALIFGPLDTLKLPPDLPPGDLPAVAFGDLGGVGIFPVPFLPDDGV